MINNKMPARDAFYSMLIPEEQPEPKQDWTPEKGEEFWFIGNRGVLSYFYTGDAFDSQTKSTLGIYRTKEEAEVMLKKLKKVVRREE